ncbi:hypothetical protein [Glycocaulis sp.]|uniref:hypothetical protein n=1 Tax=Glycocaulis sp. TaxID=1969725 RepID=UPI003D1AC759
MSRPCLEIVTYTVTQADEADARREGARALACGLPGFAGWLALSGVHDGSERADLVAWTSTDSADHAAKTVGQSEAYAPFRASIKQMGTMNHYALPAGGLALMQPGDGVEIGLFRLREGVTQDALRTAHTAMIANHLSRQPGWRGQRLVSLNDGTWADLAFAETPAAAERICASWAGQADCEAFLAMIEPVSMNFGTVN